MLIILLCQVTWRNPLLQFQAHRNRQAAIIETGKLRESIQMDINDIRTQFGAKYDKNIQQMLKAFGFKE